MTRLSILIAVLGGCFSSGKVTCDDGRICPPGYACDDTLHRCVSPEQLAACASVAEGGTCMFSGAPGTCHAGYCDPLLCGDGVIAGNEACDGTNLGGATCKTAGFYDEPGLACTAFCTFETSACTGFCGDGMINGPEQCDGAPPPGTCAGEGFDAGPLECGLTCDESFNACARFGWRTEPLDGLQALAIVGTSHTDQWVVGVGGRIAHYNGNSWTATPSTVTNTLIDVWAIAPDDVWAIGQGQNVGDAGVVLHYTGGAWGTAAVPPSKFTAVWAADATHVYVATSDHQIQWWNGSLWQQLAGPGGGVGLIAGTSPTDIWATKADSSLWHYSGAWTPTTLVGTVTDLVAVSPSNVWVIGTTGSPQFQTQIAHWNGSVWQTFINIGGGVSFTSIAAAQATNDVWVATNLGDALHFDGVAWTPVNATIDNQGMVLASFGPGEVVGAAFSGFAYRYHGQAYGTHNGGGTTASVGIWSDRADDIYAATFRSIQHFDGHTWSQPLQVSSGVTFSSIWGSGGSDVWAVGAAGLYHYNGTLPWTQPAAPTGLLEIVWGTSASDVWLFTSTGAFHGPGTWMPYLGVSANLWHSVSGTAPNDIWAVRGTTELWHWNGAAWSLQAIPAADVVAVGARTPTDVWVTASNSHVWHWDGSAWTDGIAPAIGDLTSIYAMAADDVVAGSRFEVVHFDGSRWSPIRLDIDTSSNELVQLYVATPNRIEMIYSNFPNAVRELIRTRPWKCRATETNCNDAIDDDCDGLIDHLDPDCP